MSRIVMVYDTATNTFVATNVQNQNESGDYLTTDLANLPQTNTISDPSIDTIARNDDGRVVIWDGNYWVGLGTLSENLNIGDNNILLGTSLSDVFVERENDTIRVAGWLFGNEPEPDGFISSNIVDVESAHIYTQNGYRTTVSGKMLTITTTADTSDNNPFYIACSYGVIRKKGLYNLTFGLHSDSLDEIEVSMGNQIIHQIDLTLSEYKDYTIIQELTPSIDDNAIFFRITKPNETLHLGDVRLTRGANYADWSPSYWDMMFPTESSTESKITGDFE